MTGKCFKVRWEKPHDEMKQTTPRLVSTGQRSLGCPGVERTLLSSDSWGIPARSASEASLKERLGVLNDDLLLFRGDKNGDRIVNCSLFSKEEDPQGVVILNSGPLTAGEKTLKGERKGGSGRKGQNIIFRDNLGGKTCKQEDWGTVKLIGLHSAKKNDETSTKFLQGLSEKKLCEKGLAVCYSQP